MYICAVRGRIRAAGCSAPVVWLCKGFESGQAKLPHQICAEELASGPARGILSGPSFAEEVARGLPAALVLASTDGAFAREAARALHGAALRIYPSEDVAGVEAAFTGPVPESDGFWLPPTVVLTDDTQAAIWREEVFGPVVAVMPFDDEEQAVALANDTEYGLSGSIFTGDVGRVLRVARAVEAGNLSVNSHASVRYWTPFGGYKQSGLGRELGPDAPQAFTEEKNVFIAH